MTHAVTFYPQENVSSGIVYRYVNEFMDNLFFSSYFFRKAMANIAVEQIKNDNIAQMVQFIPGKYPARTVQWTHWRHQLQMRDTCSVSHTSPVVASGKTSISVFPVVIPLFLGPVTFINATFEG